MQVTQLLTPDSTGDQLLAELHARGITVTLEGIDLRFKGPVGSLTLDLKRAIQAHTPALLIALTGYAPLDEAIVTDMAQRTTLEQIQRQLAHARALADEWSGMPLLQQVVRDWLAIERAKQRQLGGEQRRTA